MSQFLQTYQQFFLPVTQILSLTFTVYTLPFGVYFERSYPRATSYIVPFHIFLIPINQFFAINLNSSIIIYIPQFGIYFDSSYPRPTSFTAPCHSFYLYVSVVINSQLAFFHYHITFTVWRLLNVPTLGPPPVPRCVTIPYT